MTTLVATYMMVINAILMYWLKRYAVFANTVYNMQNFKQ